MGNDINPIVDLYHVVVFILFSDWNALEPYVKRILTIFFYVVGMILVWKWAKKK